MKNAKRLAAALAAGLVLTPAAAYAQRARTVEGEQPVQTKAPKPAPAPPTVKAKYEGGVVGYKKSEGTLNFDDMNQRLVFRDKKNKEMFAIPYKAVMMAWPDTKSRPSTAGRVIAGGAPYGLGLPALLMRNKSRYLTLRYQDPDSGTDGITAFKISDKALLLSVLDTLGDKAGLTARGDAYIRRKDKEPPTATTTPTSGPE